MRYLAIATDFDGVVASHGRPSGTAIEAIERLRASGRRAILVTGRTLESLQQSLSDLSAFDYVVTENGAVVYEPRTREETLLAPPLPVKFVERLKDLAVDPLEVGKVIVSAWAPHQITMLQVVQEMGLEVHIVFNRAAVMALPPGINKATGMSFVLRKLGLSAHEVVGIGDSENDHSFLERSECAATVANAVPSIRKLADIITESENGTGLAELIEELISNDLCRMQGQLQRHLLAIGRRMDGTAVTISPYGHNILLAGPSGTGKSTVAAGIVERLMQQEYQVCIIDPEGDYGTLPDVITLGNQNHAVNDSEVLAIIEDPKITLNVNLLGIPLADRPQFFGQLFPNLQAMRTRTGRPHWIVLDEAHHMMPTEWAHVGRALPQSLGETVFITVHPDHLAPMVLSLVDVVVAVGPSPDKTIRKFADATGERLVWPEGLAYQQGAAVAWFPRQAEQPFPMQIIPGRAERLRHLRKYAEGNMRHRSFFFRGPGNRHNIRAQNLAVFSQIAEGIEEETWLFHLYRGDYSRWFRRAVKDPYLAEQVERIEQRRDLEPEQTRRLIQSFIESRYTLPE
jgi:HAD superfamily hydrolase (TIGR01484 family)